MITRMAQPPTTGQVFTPGPDDVETTQYGVGVDSLGEDGDGNLIAAGTSDPRRALAAIHWYTRVVLGDWDRAHLHAELAAGERVLIPAWTRFTRTADGGWSTKRVPDGTPGAVPAVWLLPNPRAYNGNARPTTEK